MLIFKQEVEVMTKGRGGGKTPERVVALLRAEVAKKSQAAVANAIGLTRLTVQRYLKGIGEPSQATLEKIADYFGESVFHLRGESRFLVIQELWPRDGTGEPEGGRGVVKPEVDVLQKKVEEFDAPIQEVINDMQKLSDENRLIFVGRVKPIIKELIQGQKP